ncbi:MAG: peptidase S10 [Elusimicrobia bacterium]|nr:peptidase S10 [Elusimicrobiota bacterium]
MKRALALALVLPLAAAAARAADSAKKKDAGKSAESAKSAAPAAFFKPSETATEGSVTVEGRKIDYRAVAGTLVVRPKGWDDVAPLPESDAGKKEQKEPSAEASMFYVAYFKRGADAAKRPITFLYNGGPGSSTVWLHMGAFGPRRVVTADDAHTPAAPYRAVDNEWSLLDASDLVFVDAPGTGFSRVAGKDKEKAFYGVDQDAHAFAEFVTRFLSKYGRWNSPKYLFGESYGTTRSALLADELETRDDVDLNGVILLSQILNFDLSPDGPESNPSVDLPYVLALPTYAATAWYHKRLPGPPRKLGDLLAEVETFASGDYANALARGLDLPVRERDALAEKLHQYTGLPVDYLKRANLRIDGGEFEKTLEGDADTTVGRLDTRFSGPSLDPLSQRSRYDPQAAAISSAYVSVFNDYVRRTLHYGENETYKPEIWIRKWDYRHDGNTQSPNVMPDLADAMKRDPKLKVLLNAGYFDLATPFYEGVYEMRHLQIPRRLFSNIEFRFYRSGHMVYAHRPSLERLHDNVAAFIRATDDVTAP